MKTFSGAFKFVRSINLKLGKFEYPSQKHHETETDTIFLKTLACSLKCNVISHYETFLQLF